TSGTLSFTVADTTAPTITGAPSQVTVSTDANCQPPVPNLLPLVSATDNCTAPGSLAKSKSPPAGTLPAPGNYIFTITVADAAGNSSTATVALHVVDATAPTIISAPSQVTASVGADCQAAVPNVLGSVVASDNCTAAGSLTKSQSPAAGTLLGAGQHNIT